MTTRQRNQLTSLADVVAFYVLHATSPTEHQAFLSSYRCFCSPDDLADLLLSLHARLEPRLQPRVTVLLERWAAAWFEADLRPRPRLVERLVLWMSSQLDAADELKLAFVRRQSEAPEHTLPDAMNALQLPVPSQQCATVNHKFLDWPKHRIAEHLTLIEADTYNRVQPSELVDLAWQRDNKEEVAPNLTHLAARFNSVAFWVAATIVFAPAAGSRMTQHVVVKWIGVARALHRLGNFQTMLAVVSGLNHGAVQRMKQLWASLAPKHLDRFAALDQLFSPLSGYRNYREALAQHVAKNPVAIPYMPAVLGDLAMQSVGNPVRIDGCINLDRIELTGARIHDALRFQPAVYRIERDSTLVMYFLSTTLTGTTEDDLYEESKRREPIKASGPSPPASPSKGGKGGKIIEKVRMRRGSVFLPPASPMQSSPALRPAPKLVTLANRSVTSSPNLGGAIVVPSRPPPSAPVVPTSSPPAAPTALATAAASAAAAPPSAAVVSPVPTGRMVGASASSASVSLMASRGAREPVATLADAKRTLLGLSRDLESGGGPVVSLKRPASSAPTRLERSDSWPVESVHMKLPVEPADAAPLGPLVPLPAITAFQLLSASKGKEEEDDVTSSSIESASPGRLGVVVPPVATSRLFPPPASATSPATPPSPAAAVEVLTARPSQRDRAEAERLRSSKDPKSWNVADVGVWLTSLGLGGYSGLFSVNCIGGADLGDLCEADLTEMGVSKLGHRKVLLVSIAELFAPPGAAPGGSSPLRAPPAASSGPSPRAGGGTSPRINKSPRPGGALQLASPRAEPPAMTSTLYIKVRYNDRVTVSEATRLLSYAALVTVCARVAGVPIRTIHYVDADRELTPIRSDKDFEFVMDSLLSTSLSVVVNAPKKLQKSAHK